METKISPLLGVLVDYELQWKLLSYSSWKKNVIESTGQTSSSALRADWSNILKQRSTSQLTICTF